MLLADTCKVTFPDENKLFHFQLAISPGVSLFLGPSSIHVNVLITHLSLFWPNMKIIIGVGPNCNNTLFITREMQNVTFYFFETPQQTKAITLAESSSSRSKSLKLIIWW